MQTDNTVKAILFSLSAAVQTKPISYRQTTTTKKMDKINLTQPFNFVSILPSTPKSSHSREKKKANSKCEKRSKKKRGEKRRNRHPEHGRYGHLPTTTKDEQELNYSRQKEKKRKRASDAEIHNRRVESRNIRRK